MAPLEVGDHVRVVSHTPHHGRDQHDRIGVLLAVVGDILHVRLVDDPDVDFGPGELEVTVA